MLRCVKLQPSPMPCLLCLRPGTRPACTQDRLRSLAEADGLLVVKQVQEFFADFYAVNPDMFTLNLPGSTTLSRAR